MTPERWRRIRSLFEEALEREPGGLDGWLAEHAPDDPALRAEVRSLLDHHTRAGSFLEQPAAESLGHLLATDAGLAPGDVVGTYTIVRELGRGGMGRVYLASDTRLGRPVAIKALARELTGGHGHRERFRREARAAAALSHPGICAVYALEEIDDELFIVSEYLEGETLRAGIARGDRPAPAEMIRTARELASALACAHDAGFAHGDLKPENVMRTVDGRVRILDFGLARVAEVADGERETASGPAPLVGTPAYMSPEQLNGSRVDLRADLFAFGVLMCEYVSGVHPFQAGTALATYGRILEAEPARLTDLVPDVPPALAAAIERCLRKVPAERYASAGDLEADLHRQAAPASARTDSRRWWRIHQFVLVGLYGVAAVLAWQVKEWNGAIPPVWLFVVLERHRDVGHDRVGCRLEEPVIHVWWDPSIARFRPPAATAEGANAGRGSRSGHMRRRAGRKTVRPPAGRAEALPRRPRRHAPSRGPAAR